MRWPLVAYQKSGLQTVLRRSGALLLLPKRLRTMESLLPEIRSAEAVPGRRVHDGNARRDPHRHPPPPFRPQWTCSAGPPVRDGGRGEERPAGHEHELVHDRPRHLRRDRHPHGSNSRRRADK